MELAAFGGQQVSRRIYIRSNRSLGSNIDNVGRRMDSRHRMESIQVSGWSGYSYDTGHLYAWSEDILCESWNNGEIPGTMNRNKEDRLQSMEDLYPPQIAFPPQFLLAAS